MEIIGNCTNYFFAEAMLKKVTNSVVFKRSIICLVVFLLSRTVLFGELAPFGLIIMVGVYPASLAIGFFAFLGLFAASVSYFGIKYIMVYLLFEIVNNKNKGQYVALKVAACFAVVGSVIVAFEGFSFYSALMMPLECILIGSSVGLLQQFRDEFNAIWGVKKVNKGFIIDEVANKMCKKCPKKMECWVKNYDRTCSELYKMQNGGDSRYIESTCRKPFTWKDKLNQDRQVEFSIKLERAIYDSFLSKKIRIRNLIVVQTLSGLIEIDFSSLQSIQERVVVEICETVTKKKMQILEITSMENGRKKYRIIETAKFDIEVGIAKESAKFSEVSGDNYSITKINRGIYGKASAVLTLSDGMGTGKLANKQSGIAVSLIEHFMKAGLTKLNSVGLTNSVLRLGENSEMFSTVDIATINLFDGEVEFVKLGANCSYVVRGRQVIPVVSTSLPAGVFEKSDIEKFNIKLDDDNYMVMISDGIENQQSTWLGEFLYKNSTKNPQILADAILKEAKLRKGDDDMLVLVAKLTQVENNIAYPASVENNYSCGN